jgi:hypothetical protein
MQVLPAAAGVMGTNGALTDCFNSAEAGARYLVRILARYGVGCALALYERGEAARPVCICTAYGRMVLKFARL